MAAFIAPEELCARLEAIAGTIVKPRGSLLFRRGEAAFGVYLVRRGTISLGLGGMSPRLLTRKLGPGSLIGLPGTLSAKTYSLSAETLEECELIFVTRQDFLKMLRETPSLCFVVMDMLSQEICAMRDLLKPALDRNPRTRRRA